jgi:hypothetical protein
MREKRLTAFLVLACFCGHAQEQNPQHFFKNRIEITVSTYGKFSQYENALLDDYGYYAPLSEWKSKSSSLGFSYSNDLKENLFFRFGLSISNFDLSFHRDTRNESNGMTSGVNSISDAKIKSIRFNVEPGIGWIFEKTSFAFFGGIELPYTIHKPIVSSSTEFDYDSTFTTILYDYNYSGKAPGGFAIGVGAFSGFNLSLLKGFGLGAEFSSALLYYKLGGSMERSVTQTIPSSYNATSHSLYTVQGIEYSGTTVSLKFSFSF